jgi:hypothetical protein
MNLDDRICWGCEVSGVDAWPESRAFWLRSEVFHFSIGIVSHPLSRSESLFSFSKPQNNLIAELAINSLCAWIVGKMRFFEGCRSQKKG